MTVDYDPIAEQYDKLHQSPLSRNIDQYFYFKLIGDLEGKSCLDLGCGVGFYTRELKRRNAQRVVGIDISSQTIVLAKKEEAREPLGIEYILADVMELGKIGEFDLVVASYLLNHAQTSSQLLKMCQTIYANLKPNCRFISINNNLEQSPESYVVSHILQLVA